MDSENQEGLDTTEPQVESVEQTEDVAESSSSPKKSGGVRKVLGLLVGLGAAYLLGWPITPTVSAEYIDNPMGENFAIASVNQSYLGKFIHPAISAGIMCETVEAWAGAMKTTAQCTDDVKYSRGQVKENGEDPQSFLWAEMANVVHGDTTETFCFVSNDEGKTWQFGSGLAFMGVFPIQTAAKSCESLRAAKYDLSEDSEIEEASWTP